MFKRMLLLLMLPALFLACTTSDEPAAPAQAETAAETASEAIADADDADMAAEEDHDDDAMMDTSTDMTETDMEEDSEMASMNDADENSEMAEADMEEAAGEIVYTVDPSASVLTWTGSKPIGDSHTGTVQLIDGELVASEDSFVSGGFNIDMTTISDNDGSARLERHLKSDDFFGVASHPTASVEILSATPTDSGYDVVANLTIKAITNEITFPVTIDIVDGRLNGTASIVFDRSLWDVRYGSGSFFDGLGNDLIDDNISMEVAIIANS